MDSGERLQALVEASDPLAVGEYLKTLREGDLEVAKQWYRKSGAAVRRLPFKGYEQPKPTLTVVPYKDPLREPEPYEEPFVDWVSVNHPPIPAERPDPERSNRLIWCAALCTAALAPPTSAVRWLPWEFLRSREHQEKDLLIECIVGRGREWCDTFVPLAAEMSLSGSLARWAAPLLYETLATAAATWKLPAPSGHAFIFGWIETLDAEDLAGQLRTNPLMPEILFLALASRHAGRFATAKVGGMDLPGAVAELVDSGDLDRDAVIEHCLSALSHLPSRSSQRVLASTLAAIAFSTEDSLCQFQPLLGLIASCQGSVAALALPLALDLAADAEDLQELAAAVDARTERGIKTTMAKALASTALKERLGSPAVAGAATILLEGETDAVRIKTLREAGAAAPTEEATDTMSAPSEASGLWQARPPASNAPANLDVPRTLDREFLTQMKWRLESYHFSHTPSRASIGDDLGLIVRMGHYAPDQLRNVPGLIEHQAFNGTGGPYTLPLRDWASGTLTPSSYLASVKRACEALPVTYPQDRRENFPYTHYPWSTAFLDLLARESLLRLGRVPILLSHPGFTDGTLDFDQLTTRLTLQARSEAATCGPLDLVQALFRLRPTAPERADELSGLTLPIDPNVLPDRSSGAAPDGISVVRRWVADGGLPALPVSVVPDPSIGQRWDGRATLPLSFEDFAGLPIDPFAYEHGVRGPELTLSVLPLWPDFAMTYMGYSPNLASLEALRRLAAPTAIPGRAVQSLLLDTLAASQPADRIGAVDQLLLLLGDKRFDADIFLSLISERLDSGQARLAALAKALDQVFLGGGLRTMWPIALTIADAACSLDRKPAGLVDLLRVLASFAPQVPASELELPAQVETLARSSSSSKSAAEARQLLDAVNRVRGAA